MKGSLIQSLEDSRKKLVLHFVGIGGIGMSGIAEVLHNEGFQVRGSDLHEGETTRSLQSMGIPITIGHSTANVHGADVVVISSAIRKDNPELQEAKTLMIPVIPRAEMLGELMRGKTSIAVAGTHGKTTTTSMLASILFAAELDPTVIVGGKVNSFGSNARRGKGEIVLAEADESDGSFLSLPATFGLITNIDDDHLDHYKTLDAIENAFVSFVGKLPFYGLIAVCGDDPGVQRCLGRFTKPMVTYGLETANDFVAEILNQDAMGSKFRVFLKGEPLGEIHIRVPGMHNVRNALGALALSFKIGIPFAQIANGLREFTGVKRRFELRWSDENSTRAIVDDYAHHPTEIAATLSSARQYWKGKGRILVVFQPHRFTRTKECYAGFLSAFRDADYLYLLDIYPAGEDPIPGVTSEMLLHGISERKAAEQEVKYVRTLEDAEEMVLSDFRKGDLLLTLGAGTITKLPEQLIYKLTRPR